MRTCLLVIDRVNALINDKNMDVEWLQDLKTDLEHEVVTLFLWAWS